MSLHLRFYPLEDQFIPRVKSFEALMQSDVWCFCEIFPHLHLPQKFTHGGDIASPEWWPDTTPLLPPLRLYKITDAYFFPAYGILVSPDGGVFQLPAQEALCIGKHLAFLPHCKTDGLSTQFTPPYDMPRLDKGSVTLPYGAVMGNYGHFVLDGLTQAVTMTKMGVTDRFPLLAPTLTMPWQLRHIELANVHYRFVDDPVVHIDTVIYSSAMHHYLQYANKDYLDLRAVQLSRRNSTLVPPASRKIYLSRSDRHHRMNRSEDQLEAALKQDGFQIINPTTLSIDDQIELFQNVDVIIGCTGAAFTNVLYTRPGTIIIDVQPSGMESFWIQNIAAIVGCKYAPYFVQGSTTSPEGRPEIGLLFNVDVERFMSFVKDFCASPELAPA